MTNVGIIIAAAGSGTRFGGKKQLLELAGRPVLFYSLDVFAFLSGVDEVVIVGPQEDLAEVERTVDRWRREPRPGQGLPVPPVDRAVDVIAGGARRQDSVQNGLKRFGPGVEYVLVHDAARPLVLQEDIRRVLESVRANGAAVIGHPLTDSVKDERDGRVLQSLDRRHVWAVQTPQGASRALLETAYGSPGASRDHTDEVSLLQACGFDVHLVEGSRDNIKLTRPQDLELAEFLLRRRVRSASL